MDLQDYGLSSHVREEAARWPGLFPARVCGQHRDVYRLVCEGGELAGEVSGKLSYNAESGAAFPAVGDWVMIDRTDDRSGSAVIHQVLPRTSVFSRQAAGSAGGPQIIAANIDLLFICTSLNADFNLRRIERYVTAAWESMAVPVILLTKADLCDDVRGKRDEIAAVAPGVDTVVSSVEHSGEHSGGLDEIRGYIRPGKTIAFIGSSGVGKSTLINRLAGRELLATGKIREDDDRGRHTTTRRELILLPGGGLVIDTPGMRELQIYTGDLSKTFEDIEDLAAECKFGNCSHGAEPGCAVREAIEKGTLPAKRFESYQKLKREMSYEGLNSRQLENEKINRMFGSKSGMKQMFKVLKEKRKRER
ncbi:MAG: ribosome small subunit-dependent GTPase A [Treponema sp.]|nr:ribosome small subunit-dependent GTPase A [Treponema sp.]